MDLEKITMQLIRTMLHSLQVLQFHNFDTIDSILTKTRFCCNNFMINNLKHKRLCKADYLNSDF